MSAQDEHENVPAGVGLGSAAARVAETIREWQRRQRFAEREADRVALLEGGADVEHLPTLWRPVAGHAARCEPEPWKIPDPDGLTGRELDALATIIDARGRQGLAERDADRLALLEGGAGVGHPPALWRPVADRAARRQPEPWKIPNPQNFSGAELVALATIIDARRRQALAERNARRDPASANSDAVFEVPDVHGMSGEELVALAAEITAALRPGGAR